MRALPPLLYALAACGKPPPPPEVRPACDAPSVVAGVRRLADTAASSTLPAPTQGLAAIRETAARAFPELGPDTFQRLCVGRLGLTDGTSVDIGWEIFTATTTLGPSWTIKPCLGPFAADPAACTAYARGRTPIEEAALRVAASRRGAQVGTAALQADGKIRLALAPGGGAPEVTVLFSPEDFAASGWVTDAPLTTVGQAVPVRAPKLTGTPGEPGDTGATAR